MICIFLLFLMPSSGNTTTLQGTLMDIINDRAKVSEACMQYNASASPKNTQPLIPALLSRYTTLTKDTITQSDIDSVIYLNTHQIIDYLRNRKKQRNISITKANDSLLELSFSIFALDIKYHREYLLAKGALQSGLYLYSWSVDAANKFSGNIPIVSPTISWLLGKGARFTISDIIMSTDNFKTLDSGMIPFLLPAACQLFGESNNSVNNSEFLMTYIASFLKAAASERNAAMDSAEICQSIEGDHKIAGLFNYKCTDFDEWKDASKQLSIYKLVTSSKQTIMDQLSKTLFDNYSKLLDANRGHKDSGIGKVASSLQYDITIISNGENPNPHYLHLVNMLGLCRTEISEIINKRADRISAIHRIIGNDSGKIIIPMELASNPFSNIYLTVKPERGYDQCDDIFSSDSIAYKAKLIKDIYDSLHLAKVLIYGYSSAEVPQEKCIKRTGAKNAIEANTILSDKRAKNWVNILSSMKVEAIGIGMGVDSIPEHIGKPELQRRIEIHLIFSEEQPPLGKCLEAFPLAIRKYPPKNQ